MKRESSKKEIKRGRPPMPEGETLDAVIPATRCKLNERKAFEKAAIRDGLKLGEWLRQTLKKAVEK